MKRKTLTTIMAVAVCAAMMGTTCFAAGGELSDPTAGGEITGDSTVKNPIYSVVVPTAVEFGIDAFEQAGQTNSQIASADLTVYNKSNVAVRVQADIKLTPGTNVTLVESADEVTETDATKNLFIGLEVPKTVVLTLNAAADATGNDATAVGSYTKHSDNKLYLTSGLTAEETGTGGAFNGESAATASDIKAETIKGNTITYAAGTEADPQYVIALGTESVSVAFALDKADYYKVYSKSSDATGTDKFYKKASTADGATAFRLTGAVNSRAPWADNDIKATITYSFLGIRNANYATQTADAAADNPNIAYVAGTAKLLKEVTGPEFTASNGGLVRYTAGEGDDAVASIIDIIWDGTDGNPMSAMRFVTHDTSAKTIQMVSDTLQYWVSQGVTSKAAKITYKTVGNETKTVDVTFKLQ